VTFRKLDETTFVWGQVGSAEIAQAAASGVTMIIDNRPDGEEPGQPASSEIEAAANAAGMDFRYIPVGSGFSANQVQAMTAALDEANGPVLAYCKSGTRSTFLWALARAEKGDPAEELSQKAAAAGYDLTPIRFFLQR
jgi:uncharacterized protein (TIGR01244 family)